MITLLLVIIALVCFLLDAFRVQASVNLGTLGLAFLTVALLVNFYPFAR